MCIPELLQIPHDVFFSLDLELIFCLNHKIFFFPPSIRICDTNVQHSSWNLCSENKVCISYQMSSLERMNVFLLGDIKAV